MRVPSSTPGGTLTFSFSSLATRVSPLQVWQGSPMMDPAPPQAPHVRATEKKPCWYRICPRPWHWVQTVGPRPEALPRPLQVGHVSRRRILISVSEPKIASSNSIARSKRRSSPRCWREARGWPPPILNISPNRSPKMSPKSTEPLNPLNPPGPGPLTPAWPKRSYAARLSESASTW